MPPSEGKAVIMSLDTHKEDTDVKLGASSNETNNNNPVKDVEVPKLNAKHVDMLDDLTNQLVKALDTNDVVDWKPSDESPFGKLISRKNRYNEISICSDFIEEVIHNNSLIRKKMQIFADFLRLFSFLVNSIRLTCPDI